VSTPSYTAATGTVRKWLDTSVTGAVVSLSGRQAINTPTAADTRDLIAKLTATLPTPPPPAAPVVQFARVAIASAANITTGTPSEGIVIVQAWEVAAAKAANPSADVGMYFNLGAMTSGSTTVGLYPALTYNGAYGLGVTITDYPTLEMADPANAAYQQAWAAMAIRQAQQVGARFVFADNTDLIASGPQTKYPTDAAYQAAVLSMLEAVHPVLASAGVGLVPNFGSCSTYPEVAISWLAYVDGFMDEQFLKWGTVAGTGYRSALGAMGQLNEATAAAAAGKIFIGVTHSADGDQAAATYGLATMLLTGGTYCFSTPPEYAAESMPAAAPLVAELGSPSGTFTGGNGVYQREFLNGTVSVNMTTSPPTGMIEVIS
jgi:hypothetical protein